jgi:ABC-type amino acid transport substrate-binding protein
MTNAKVVNKTGSDDELSVTDRRKFIKGAGILLGAGAVSAFATPAMAALSTPAMIAPTVTSLPRANITGGGSILDKVLSTKQISFGVDLSFAPLQYKKPDGTPTGYIIDLANKLAASLGATPKWVEIPFGDIFAGQAAGKFDMSGIAATIKPERAQKVLFSGAPAFVESNVVLFKPGYRISNLSSLNSSSVTIAVVLGSSQESAAQLLYPKAKLKRLENQAALADVSAGRSNAMIVGEFSVADAIKANPKLTVFRGKPVFVDENSFFMPAGDFAMKHYVDTWLRYETSHNTLAGLWDKYVGNNARKIGLQSVSIKSAWS